MWEERFGETRYVPLGLVAWADAWLSGTLVAIFVAFRPAWLATYTDRLYLPPKPAP